MTTAIFRYLDPATIALGQKPWAKVDTDAATSYGRTERRRSVTNIRDVLSGGNPTPGFASDIDVAGFAVYSHSPAKETQFTDHAAVLDGYYAEVESLLREKLPGKVRKVVIFDHTIRRHDPSSPRQPVQQVHVDQTPAAAAARVRRHVAPADEADNLLKGRYQLINVWRPIGHPATDFPLAVVDWRTTSPEDLIAVDLLYPLLGGAAEKEKQQQREEIDYRGKEKLPDPESVKSTAGYEVKGETYGVVPNENHKMYYVKDMGVDEVMFIKCFDSWGDGKEGGKKGVAALTPHTAFIDPATPAGTPGRQSIEVRCLVFYE
ncbi:hypothetical protein B0H63DRAFT_2192 [Podospora didyma]|uniref:Aspirochlorine biosynthesis protein N n=1 Tax=Podospora didyma TaxID=330526 RepID=A0AAE0U6W7_9PEZI|nr:hypothetical protein B0H63DRAFT_2192 [Podospora didyma]